MMVEGLLSEEVTLDQRQEVPEPAIQNPGVGGELRGLGGWGVEQHSEQIG